MTDRAEVELTIQIGMETDEEALAVLAREARRAAKEALARGVGQAEYVHETQWCSGAMRVTVRRHGLEAPEILSVAKACEHQVWEPLTRSPERHHRRRCCGCGRIEVYAPTQRGRGGWHWLEASRVSSVAANRPALMSASGQENLARESPRLARAMGIPVPFRRTEAV